MAQTVADTQASDENKVTLRVQISNYDYGMFEGSDTHLISGTRRDLAAVLGKLRSDGCTVFQFSTEQGDPVSSSDFNQWIRVKLPPIPEDNLQEVGPPTP